MSDAYDAVDAAMTDIDRLRQFLRKRSTVQVRSPEECSVIKAVCLTWFKNHRPPIRTALEEDLLADIDLVYKQLLTASDRATSRSRYNADLKTLRSELVEIRGYTMTASSSVSVSTSDTPPSFAPLVSDPAMQAILKRRWAECATCVSYSAPLAAIVMMGGLLEALLLARVHKTPNKAPIFGAAKAPRDRSAGKTAPLQDWTLRHYIDVAHELGWISSSARDVGEIVRDYRNYIHPYKELAHGVAVADGDAKLFWEIAKGIARQRLS